MSPGEAILAILIGIVGIISGSIVPFIVTIHGRLSTTEANQLFIREQIAMLFVKLDELDDDVNKVMSRQRPNE